MLVLATVPVHETSLANQYFYSSYTLGRGYCIVGFIERHLFQQMALFVKIVFFKIRSFTISVTWLNIVRVSFLFIVQLISIWSCTPIYHFTGESYWAHTAIAFTLACCHLSFTVLFHFSLSVSP